MNADGTNPTRLTFTESAGEASTSWSPDGTKIAFASNRDDREAGSWNWEIYVMNADGTGQTRLTNDLAADDSANFGTPTPIDPIQTVLTLNTITTVPWGNDVTVTGKLADASNSQGVEGKTITFDGTGADNLPDNVVTNADGTFSAIGASPNTVAAGWKVQAHFAGDSDYAASNSATSTYNTVKHSVVLFVSAASSTVPWGNPTTFTATLTDASLGGAVPISGETISFNGTGIIGVADAITDDNGKATGTGTAPKTVATGWAYQAHYAGNSLYLAKDTAQKTYSTTKHSVSLAVSAASSAVPWGNPTTFTATLTDASRGGVAISGKTIHFDGSGVIAAAADKTTDSTGKAIATGTAPKTVATGWKYQTHFAGDSLYASKDSTIKTYSTTKHTTSLSLAVSPSTVSPGGTYKVYGYLRDSSVSGTPPISSKTITFTAESPITISSKTTDTTGKYTADGLKAPTKAGSYDIQAHYAGNSLYSAKDSSTRTLTVTAP
jgi:hypothetical protein